MLLRRAGLHVLRTLAGAAASVRTSLPLPVLVFAVAALAGCAQGPAGLSSSFQNERIFTNLAPQHPKGTRPQTAQGLVPIDGGVGATLTLGDGSSAPGRRSAGGTDSPDLAGGGSFTLNFDNAPLAEVVRAILTGALELNYASAGDLAGTVTISSARPVRRDELLTILESLLATEGFALAQRGGTYLIEPTGVGAGRSGGGGAGFGTTVVPLRHVSVATMSTILTGFVVAADNLRVSTAGNSVIIRGPADRRAEAADAVLSFDADWMAGQTAKIYELRRATPEAVVAELDEIFKSTEGAGANGTIEFRAIPRLKAVMAVSLNPRLVSRAGSAIRDLDLANPSVDNNVFVYRARYRNAAELARVVGNLFDATTDTGAQRGSTDPTAGSQDASGFATSELEPGSSGGLGGGGIGGDDGGGDDGDRFSAAASLFPGEGEDADGGAAASIDLSTSQDRAASAVRVSADTANNAVVVVADGATYEKILATLKALDQAPAQVAINVTIAEVRLTDQLEFGVQYFVKSNSVGLGENNGSFQLFTDVANTLQRQLPGFNFVVGSNSNPDVIISALDAITDVEVLSSPSLVVVENETAELQVGDSVPLTVRQAQSVQDVDAPLVNQVEYRDTGIILEVTPRIGENDAVTMQVEQEISAVASDANTLTPTFSRRRVASQISVQSGQTVLLAGLISTSRDVSDSGIPLLKDVPKVGKLFGNQARNAGRTELVVLIRPVVIRNGEDASSVAQDFRSRLNVIGDRTGGTVVLKP